MSNPYTEHLKESAAKMAEIEAARLRAFREPHLNQRETPVQRPSTDHKDTP
jgi:hypothetical protein